MHILKGLPIREEGLESVRYNSIWEYKDKNYFIKLITPSCFMTSTNTISIFQAKEEALKNAKFYQQLAKDRFYHPNTKFLVCAQEGKPIILAIMPKLQVLHDFMVTEMKEKCKMVEEKYNVSLGSDTECGFNFGYDEDGEVYYHDLHLFDISYYKLREKLLVGVIKLPENYNLEEVLRDFYKDKKCQI